MKAGRWRPLSGFRDKDASIRFHVSVVALQNQSADVAGEMVLDKQRQALPSGKIFPVLAR
jgi:hypothetical protein